MLTHHLTQGRILLLDLNLGWEQYLVWLKMFQKWTQMIYLARFFNWVWVYSNWILDEKRAPDVPALVYFEMLFWIHLITHRKFWKRPHLIAIEIFAGLFSRHNHCQAMVGLVDCLPSPHLPLHSYQLRIYARQEKLAGPFLVWSWVNIEAKLSTGIKRTLNPFDLVQGPQVQFRGSLTVKNTCRHQGGNLCVCGVLWWIFATKTELTIDTPTNVIENNKYFEISGTWNDARGVIPETSVRKKVKASKTWIVSNMCPLGFRKSTSASQ